MSMTQTVRPWYRQIWPWALMAPPAASVIFWVVIITTMAGPPDLVVADYAKVGLTYAQDHTRLNAAAQLGVAAAARVDRRSGHVSLRLDGLSTPPATLELTLVHATNAQHDRTIDLQRNSAGLYHGDVGQPITGARQLRLTPGGDQWLLTARLDAASEALDLVPYRRSDGS